jgi:hypothetical protein
MTVILLLEVRIIAPIGIGIGEVTKGGVRRKRTVVMTIRRGMSMDSSAVTREDAVIGLNEAAGDRSSDSSQGKDFLKIDFRIGSWFSALEDSSSCILSILFLVIFSGLAIAADIRPATAELILIVKQKISTSKKGFI